MNQIKDNLRSEMIAELEKNILPFWMVKVKDEEEGGFYGQVDSAGKPVPGAKKGGVLNARILWTFSAAYRALKKEEYKLTAERAYHYLCQYFIDLDYGGTYWELDQTGEISDGRKQIYALAFTIYGLSEYYRISGDQKVLDRAIELYESIEKYSFDRENNGYFEAFARDWTPLEDLRLSAKDQNESKTMNTHLHILEAYTNLYRIWKDKTLYERLKNLVNLFLDRFLNNEGHLNLFFDDHWNLKSDLISFGHDIESSWLILEAAEVIDDLELIGRAKMAAIKITEQNRKGLDKDGGLSYEYFPSSSEWDHDKHWWPQAEAVVGYLNAYQLSGNQEYMDIALKTWGFIKKYLVDKEYGEWHWSVDRQGRPNRNEGKAGFWKCPYHNSRMCLEVISRMKHS